MILSEMRDSLRRKVGNPTDTDVSDTDLNRYLNESQRYIGDRFPFQMTRTLVTFPTVVGTTRYELPSDLNTLMYVANRTTRRPLRRRRANARGLTEAPSTTPAEPSHYNRALGWLEFNCKPDKVYTIALFYKNDMADLVNDGDEPVIPLSWHDGIVKFARYLFYDEKQDFAKAQYMYASWTLWLESKPDELQDELLYDDDGAIEMPTLLGSEHPRRGYPRFDTEE